MEATKDYKGMSKGLKGWNKRFPVGKDETVWVSIRKRTYHTKPIEPIFWNLSHKMFNPWIHNDIT